MIRRTSNNVTTGLGISLLLGLFSLAGCTVITDFDEADENADMVLEDAEGKIIVSGLLAPENITLTTGGSEGILTLLFNRRLPLTDAEAIGALIGNELLLVLDRADDTVGVDITSVRVAEMPASVGEFQVKVGGGGGRIVVTFYNGAELLRPVASGQRFNLILDVDDNGVLASGVYTFVVAAE